MTIVFVSNFINHHQKPVADELYRLTNGNYYFIATQAIPTSFLDAGYPDYSNLPYVLRAYEDEETYQEARDIADSADVVICSGPDEYTVKRIKENKITFRYAERYFKAKPFWRHPGMVKYLFFHDAIYRNRRLYMLAASAYLANEMRLVGAYPDKIYKWGYFPNVENIDIQKNLAAKRQTMLKLLWCARFIDWKHPEMIPKLANMLLENGYENFEIEMIGSGIEEDSIKQLCSELNVGKFVKMIGNIPNEQVIQKMKEANIFLFTSDRNEGWGAVLNEAMASGCAVVVSNRIGAAPFLVKDNVNGLLFKSQSIKDLFRKVKFLFDNRYLIENYAKSAYESMSHTWSPKNAAERFYKLSLALLEGTDISYKEGPCSKALPQ